MSCCIGTSRVESKIQEGLVIIETRSGVLGLALWGGQCREYILLVLMELISTLWIDAVE